MAYEKSLCQGCGLPKEETFDPAGDDHYEVVVLQCHACAARDRRAHKRNASREPGDRPDMGIYYAVTGRDDE